MHLINDSPTVTTRTVFGGVWYGCTLTDVELLYLKLDEYSVTKLKLKQNCSVWEKVEKANEVP